MMRLDAKAGGDASSPPMRKHYRIKVAPFIVWRDDRPRFIPGPQERALGFKGRDLRHGAQGPWYTLEEARAWGQAMHAEIEARRNGAAAQPPAAVQRTTVAELLRDYLASRDFAGNAESTRRYQASVANAILWEKDRRTGKASGRMTVLARSPVRFIEPADVKGFYEHTVAQRGLHMAYQVVMLLSAAFKWGRTSTHWRLPGNPCHQLGLTAPPPRVFVWTAEMIRYFVEAADAMGRPEMGDACLLGVFSAQRQGDRLAMQESGLERDLMRFHQSKTGVLLEIPQLDALRRRMLARLERRKALPHKVVSTYVLIDERRNVPWSPRAYNALFRAVRAAAAERAASEGKNWLTAALLEARDQDLRDTIITWLALADCTLPQIAAISGHAMGSITTTIRHYMAMDPRLAADAMGKLAGWMDREGMQL